MKSSTVVSGEEVLLSSEGFASGNSGGMQGREVSLHGSLPWETVSQLPRICCLLLGTLDGKLASGMLLQSLWAGSAFLCFALAVF